MYVVIFRADIKQLDDEYHQVAERMRELALSEFGCVSFHAVMQENKEITISYWESLDQIRAWKQNLEHLAAQQKGRGHWYSAYRVEIAEVIRGYGYGQPE